MGEKGDRQVRNRAHERKPPRRNAFGQNFRTGHTGGAPAVMNQKSPDWPTCTPSLMDQAALTNQVLFGTSTSAVKTQIWIAVSISLLVVALRQYSTRSRTTRTCGEGRNSVASASVSPRAHGETDHIVHFWTVESYLMYTCGFCPKRVIFRGRNAQGLPVYRSVCFLLSSSLTLLRVDFCRLVQQFRYDIQWQTHNSGVTALAHKNCC